MGSNKIKYEEKATLGRVSFSNGFIKTSVVKKTASTNATKLLYRYV
jgi:hypothetical protein